MRASRIRVRAAAEQDGVALFELLRQLCELDDFRRAHEREILRIEVDDLPLARERRFGDGLERRLAVFLVIVEARLRGYDGESFEFIAHGFHADTPV
ncbi:hypothetical protein NLI96_g13388 [Meripilus lineatus]|uniref:Uncharacterized protein n=1 Tax=Meripilus lineatus TaxID=2056292 RepID=A0AAD5UN85_9APHY|nr:hypothetical protein NLI96_g13388 [Physisporinus lineatus]